MSREYKLFSCPHCHRDDHCSIVSAEKYPLFLVTCQCDFSVGPYNSIERAVHEWNAQATKWKLGASDE
jgi:hypothetical protein